MALRAIGAMPTRSTAPERPTEARARALRRKLEDLRRLYRAPWLTPEERAELVVQARRLQELIQKEERSAKANANKERIYTAVL